MNLNYKKNIKYIEYVLHLHRGGFVFVLLFQWQDYKSAKQTRKIYPLFGTKNSKTAETYFVVHIHYHILDYVVCITNDFKFNIFYNRLAFEVEIIWRKLFDLEQKILKTLISEFFSYISEKISLSELEEFDRNHFAFEFGCN